MGHNDHRRRLQAAEDMRQGSGRKAGRHENQLDRITRGRAIGNCKESMGEMNQWSYDGKKRGGVQVTGMGGIGTGGSGIGIFGREVVDFAVGKEARRKNLAFLSWMKEMEEEWIAGIGAGAVVGGGFLVERSDNCCE